MTAKRRLFGGGNAGVYSGRSCENALNMVGIWLVVSTIMKNMKVSWNDYSHIVLKHTVKHVPNHHPDMVGIC